MFAYFRRLTRRFVRKSTYLDREPLNKVSIIILILIDIFVLFNVFSGLSNIAQFPLSPAEKFPCFPAYQTYQTEPQKKLDFRAITIEEQIKQLDLIPPDRRAISPSENRWGKVSPLCAEFVQKRNALNSPKNLEFIANLDKLRIENSKLQQEINTLQRQYDSTLLEKIAGQETRNSINVTTAEKAKSEIEQKKAKIAENKTKYRTAQEQLIQTLSSADLLALLDNTAEYQTLEQAYQSDSFWYPNRQFLLQVLFLLPLIAIAYFWHSAASRRNKGLQSLLSWHLLLIFCVPLLVKFFEFIQFGNLFSEVLEFFIVIFGGLRFIANYLLIFTIPLLGFGLIKVLQSFVFNPRSQEKDRLQKKIRIQRHLCIDCGFKLRLEDDFCPSCGFYQYQDCPNCGEKTYKFASFCRKCGSELNDRE